MTFRTSRLSHSARARLIATSYRLLGLISFFTVGFIVRESLVKCRSEGALRLEGKDYPVSDGDIVNFRFAV